MAPVMSNRVRCVCGCGLFEVYDKGLKCAECQKRYPYPAPRDFVGVGMVQMTKKEHLEYHKRQEGNE